MTMLPKMRRSTDKNLTLATAGVAGMAKELIDLRAALALERERIARLIEGMDEQYGSGVVEAISDKVRRME